MGKSKSTDPELEEFNKFFENNAVPADATPPVDFEIGSTERLYPDDSQQSEDDEYDDDMQQGGDYMPGPPTRMVGGNGNSAFAPTVLDRYDSDSLNYLKESVTDDLARDLIVKVYNARLTPDCKMDVVSLILTFSSREYVITGYEHDHEMRKRWLEFRDSLNKLKAKTRLVNKTNGELTFTLSLLEGHFNNKLTRARRGFERKAQITQNMTQTSTTQVANEDEPRSGLRRFFGSR